MEEVNVDWPIRLARLVAEKNDGTKLLHLTNLACHQELGRKVSKILDQNVSSSDDFYNGRLKSYVLLFVFQYKAELGMREAYPDTIIARSSHTFGYFANFLRRFINDSDINIK